MVGSMKLKDSTVEQPPAQKIAKPIRRRRIVSFRLLDRYVRVNVFVGSEAADYDIHLLS